jgi:hypothetical protein
LEIDVMSVHKAALCLLLAGCTTVPLASIPKLSRIDFMTTDLARVRVAIALPQALAPQPGGVSMQMKYRVGDEPEKQEILLLVQTRPVAGQPGLPAVDSASGTAYIFQLSGLDVEKLNALRASVGAAKAKGQKGSLSLGVEAKQFCSLSALPAGPLLTSTFVLTSENDGFVALSRDFDLRSDPDVAAGLGALKPCSG